ncbi:MAG TPA: hypothetical protein VGT05_04840 [Patescibacteria group bacterium]|nr:hypothetical protein [Patescibacteria group bacterium]
MDPNTQSVLQQSSVQQQAQSLRGQPVSVPVAAKENAPLIVKTGNEFATQSEIVLSPEVAAAGVEAQPIQEVIRQDAQQAGVMPTKDLTPVPTNPTLINLPDETVQSILQTPKAIKQSVTWLATLIRKVLKKEAMQKGKQT